MRKTICILATFFCLACTPKEPSEVLVLPSLHGAHKVNPNYSYDDLMQIVTAYNANIIGVEIRPEDLQMDSDTLARYYPTEMIKVRDSFRGKVTGIDFYSEDTRNVPVSRKIFTDTTTEIGRMKKLLTAMQKDSVYLARFEKTGIPRIYEEQKKIALTYSAEELLKGEYDSLTWEQYRLEDSLNKGTAYEAYSRINNHRDLQITRNALNLVKANPGKRILLLVGANHRNRLVDSLGKMKGIKAVKTLETGD